ncbi:MAG: hypothetical protein NTV54_08455 [Ignavibacteriales bacterium]|nr:hypothetical protein [Ignavibacteriales bacterium]
MNAQGVKDEEHLEELLRNDNYIVQVKLDGMRAVVHITHTGLRIFSRSAGVADPTRPLEKTSSLPHLADLKFPALVGTILDAEILIPGKDSAELAGTVHRKELDDDNARVRVFIFDCLRLCGKDLCGQTLRSRLDSLAKISHLLQSDYMTVLPFAQTTVQKKTLYDRIIASGGEGVMLKNLNATYLEGGRPSNNWFKAKKSATFDCVVIGFTTGKGKYNTQIGALRFGQYVDGTLVELGQASGMSDRERMVFSLSPDEYIGKVVTIKGMERLKSGAVRHPQFAGLRSDKHATECTWYRGEQ